MRIFKFSLVGVMVCGLLAACGANEAKPIEELKVKASNEKEITEFSPQAKEWIAEMLAEFNRSPEESFDEVGHDDVGFIYYKKAKSLYENMHQYIHHKNESFNEDFANLRLLAAGIDHNQFVRTAHIENTGMEKENLEHIKDWKPVPISTEKAFVYMKELLNDIDVAINKNGEGKTFGVTHLLNGARVKEVESFIKHNGGT